MSAAVAWKCVHMDGCPTPGACAEVATCIPTMQKQASAAIDFAAQRADTRDVSAFAVLAGDSAEAESMPSPTQCREVALMNDTDAMRWATEFMATVANLESAGEKIDKALMLSWFSSAIMCGFDEMSRRAAAQSAGLRQVNKSLVKTIDRLTGAPGFWAMIRGRWRLWWNLCPKCNSDAPFLDTCRVCNGFRDAFSQPDTFVMRAARNRVWWARFTRTEIPKPAGAEVGCLAIVALGKMIGIFFGGLALGVVVCGVLLWLVWHCDDGKGPR